MAALRGALKDRMDWERASIWLPDRIFQHVKFLSFTAIRKARPPHRSLDFHRVIVRKVRDYNVTLIQNDLHCPLMRMIRSCCSLVLIFFSASFSQVASYAGEARFRFRYASRYFRTSYEKQNHFMPEKMDTIRQAIEAGKCGWGEKRQIKRPLGCKFR